MYAAIASIQALTNAEIATACADYFKVGGFSLPKQQEILKKISDARDHYLENWTAQLKKLNGKFKWSEEVEAGPKIVFTANPKEQGLTTKHAQIIAEAADAGWQGKSLQIDGPNFENQEVMVKQVLWDIGGGNRVPATLIHFRMTRFGGQKAAKALLEKGEMTTEEGKITVGAAVLKADDQGGYWNIIRAAVGTVNHHYFVLKDMKPTMEKVNAAYALEPKLYQIQIETQDPTGTYSLTGESNEAVNAMATQYVQYIQVIKEFLATGKAGDKTPMFNRFLWDAPPDKKKSKPSKGPQKPIYVIAKPYGAVLPQLPNGHNLIKEGIVISSLNNPVYNSSDQSQFHIFDDIAKAHIFLNPPGGCMGLKEGVETYKGVGWGIMPGVPSLKTVAHLLKMLEESGEINAKPATSEDTEALYWSKQAAILQAYPGHGTVTPNDAHEIATDVAYVAALNQYRNGDAPGAISAMKTYVAGKLGVPVKDLSKQPGFDIQGEYTRGAGWKRTMRIGWTRQKLVNLFGKNVHVAHCPTTGFINFFTRVQANGALISTAIKPFYGIPVTNESGGMESDVGGSPTQDIPKGGSQGIFTCLRKNYYEGIMYFDISLLLRTDWYMVGTGDTYGSTKAARYLTPEGIKSAGAVASGNVHCGSHYQISFRHDIDLREYLYAVSCAKSYDVKTNDRDVVRELFQKSGWTTFAQGRSIEQVVNFTGEDVP